MSQMRLSFLLPLVAFGILALVGGMALYGTLSGSRDPTQLPSVFVDKASTANQFTAACANWISNWQQRVSDDVSGQTGFGEFLCVMVCALPRRSTRA
jgi:hypothetical protein